MTYFFAAFRAANFFALAPLGVLLVAFLVAFFAAFLVPLLTLVTAFFFVLFVPFCG